MGLGGGRGGLGFGGGLGEGGDGLLSTGDGGSGGGGEGGSGGRAGGDGGASAWGGGGWSPKGGGGLVPSAQQSGCSKQPLYTPGEAGDSYAAVRWWRHGQATWAGRQAGRDSLVRMVTLLEPSGSRHASPAGAVRLPTVSAHCQAEGAVSGVGGAQDGWVVGGSSSDRWLDGR